MLTKLSVTGLVLFLTIAGAACNRDRAEFRDVEDQVEQSLEASGLRDISADQDTEQGIVTLKGEVQSESEKARAEEIARSAASGQTVVNEIAVRPEGTNAGEVQSSLDDGIEENFHAKLAENKIDGVDYDSNEGVLTLTGDVDSAALRQRAEQLAASVPNVKQVVNKLEIEGDAVRPTTRQ
jgi:hyperosmotically inducible periplasmic protein